jgi:PAS domain S-box-containing protein
MPRGLRSTASGSDPGLGGIEEQYRLLMESVTDYALVLLDSEGRVAAWNVSAERIFGYQAVEIVGQPFRVFFTPEDVAARQPDEQLRTAATTDRVEEEHWCIHRDGSRLWCRGVLTALRREDGALRGFAAVLRDQSELRFREEEIQRANERFRLATAAVKGVLYEADMTTGTVLRSMGLFALVGYHPDEAEPTVAWWEERIHPDDRPACLGAASIILADPKQGQYELDYRVRHKDGRWIDVWDRAVILRDPLGRPIHIVGNTFDITERIRAEKALRESEERHRIITELTSDYNYAVRLDPDGSSHLELITEGFTRITGYTLDEVNARGGYTILIHPEDRGIADQGIARVLSGQANACVLRIFTRGGDVRWVRNLNKPAWDEKRTRVVRIVGAAQDVTDRIQAEESLRESRERLQALSRQLIVAQENERRRLAHELHDEIGQTLTAISINLQAVKVVGKSAQPRLEEAIAIVDRAIDQVRHLSLDLRPSMLDDLGLESALRWYTDRQSRRTGLPIRLDTDLKGQRLPAELETTCFRVAQEALTNVVRHAHAKHAWIELQLQGSTLNLSIRDDGIGFEPMAARGRAADGASFGLLGMQERVELLRGAFAVESLVGRGTSIRARFAVANRPFTPEPSEEITPHETDSSPAGR